MLTIKSFNREKPDREEFLSWANADDNALEKLVPYISRLADFFENLYETGEDDLTDEEFNQCYNSLRILTAHQYRGGIKEALRVLIYADHDEDEVIVDAVFSYLEDSVRSADFEDVYQAWIKFKKVDDNGDESLLGILGRTGKTNEVVQRRLKELLWDEECYSKGLALPDCGDPIIHKEVRQRHIEIAPLVKYFSNYRSMRFYFDEWLELSEYWTSFEYPDEDIFHF